MKNLDLLLAVTGAEDFALMEQIQQNLASDALPHVVYGRVEPPLIHFHVQIDPDRSYECAAIADGVEPARDHPPATSISRR